jgi:hypothetical protein
MRVTSLFDGQTLDGWIQIPANSWTVKDGAMASTGAGRGVIYTEGDCGNYRLIFTVRHVGAEPVKGDHRACVLIFCTRPGEDAPALDALGGIQLQPPYGGSWDYRPGKNNAGTGLFTRVFDGRQPQGPDGKPRFDEHQWHQVELLVNAREGTARMAVAQPAGTKAIEVLRFKDPTAGKLGPIAWQIHNQGLFDEYKDIYIEVNPKEDDLLTTR